MPPDATFRKRRSFELCLIFLLIASTLFGCDDLWDYLWGLFSAGHHSTKVMWWRLSKATTTGERTWHQSELYRHHFTTWFFCQMKMQKPRRNDEKVPILAHQFFCVFVVDSAKYTSTRYQWLLTYTRTDTSQLIRDTRYLVWIYILATDTWYRNIWE